MASKRFLIDTSAWIFALRKNPHTEIKERIDKLLEHHSVVTAGMVKLELLGGVKEDSEFSRLKTYLDALENIEIDSRLWEEASQLAFDLRRKGATVPYTDILIAAVAIRTKAVLLHADSHFDLIAQYAKLKLESFVASIP